MYLGVTLDRTLSYKQHIEKVKGKVRTRNNLLHKLANSSWGANTSTCELLPLHSAIQLQNMPVLCGKDHAMQRKLTPPLMTAADASLGACDLRMLTVYMSWLVSPHLAFRRSVASRTERRRQADDTRHPCHNHQPAPSRLKSRKSFLHEVQPLSQPPQTARLTLWEEQRSAKQHLAKLPIPTSEQLAPGHKSEWKLWKSLNRLRTGMGRSKTNMSKWGYADTANIIEFSSLLFLLILLLVVVLLFFFVIQRVFIDPFKVPHPVTNI